MVYLATITLAPALAAAATLTPMDLGTSSPGPPRTPPPEVHSTELSVLTYNVRGLPWPLAAGRAAALKEIGAELAQMREDGRQPDVVLIQEGFRGEVRDLVKASGYRYWVQGPNRSERAADAPTAEGRAYRTVRYLNSGEGWGKFTGAGLHILSDVPVADVRAAPYRYCAGFDCLANKGVMLARLDLPQVPGGVDIINTHLNSKRASKVPLARSLAAHNLQTEQLIAFINDHRDEGAPLLVGGDFNVRNAPDRYNHQAALRPYRVVSEYCNDPASACEGQSPQAGAQPWLQSQDLQAFVPAGAVDVRPVKVETLFKAGAARASLSDHDGYLVRYRLSWSPPVATPAPVEIKPQFKTPGLKVSWKY